MSTNDDQDRIPYQDGPLTAANATRRLGSDGRLNEGALAGYQGPDGKTYAWAGDREAPFVRVLHNPPALVAVSSIPTVPSSGVMIAATIAAELHEAWATDERDPTLNPPARWLLLFDRTDAPLAGDQPIVAPLRLCGTSAYDFIEAPLQFNTGIVLAISTTPNVYTPIAAASDYAMTARVLAGS